MTPRAALVPAVTAPLLLIGGWLLAGSRQPAGYSQVHDTISSLAARGTPDRVVMTTALAGLGLCHLMTAALLRPAARAGRIALAVGGLATVLVAALPEPHHGSSAAHAGAASAAFVALALWPVLAGGGDRERLLSRPAGVAATAVLLVLLGIFGATVDSSVVGLTERVLAGAQALWPLAVVGAWISAEERR
jgi:hypothetical membrane protein